MDQPRYLPGWLVTGLYGLALALLSWLIVRFALPDSLLFLFWVPCMLAAFFYGRWVYQSMIVALVAAAIWVTTRVSASFTTSLITIVVTALSGVALAELMRVVAQTHARAQAALNRQSEESRHLAEMGMALLDCEQVERVFELLGDFLAQVTADMLIIINQTTPDQQSLITRQIIGLDGALWKQAEQLAGFEVIGKVSPIAPEWRAYFYQPRLQKIPGGFSALAASEVPKTVGKMLEKLCGLHETFTIGIADQNTLWGNVHIIARRPAVSLPVHLIEAVVYQCFATLSRIHTMRKLAVSNELLEQTGRMARVGGWEKNMLTGDDYWSVMTREIHEVSDDFIPSMQNALQFYKEGPNRDKIIEVVNRAIEHGEPYDVELQIVTATGNEQWVRTMGYPEFQDGRCVRLYGVFQDIAERKHAEETLREQEQFVTTLNDITRVALESSGLEDMLQTLANRMGELFHADGCYLTLWDEEAQMTLAGAAYGALHDHYRAVKLEPGEPTVTAAVLRSGKPIPNEDVYHTPYLSRRLADLFPDRSLLGLPLFAGERKLGAALIAYNEPHQFTAQEIARGEQVARQIALAVAKTLLYQDLQMHAEQLETRVQERTAELQAQYAHLDAILRSVGDAICVTDPARRIRYVNPAFTTMTGYPEAEVLAQDVSEIGAFTDLGARLPAIIASLAQEKLWRGDTRVQRKDGRHYDAAWTINLLYSDAGQELGYVFTHQDISQAKDLERARAQFITNVSHQFLTPLTPLKTGIYLLQRGHLSEKQQQQVQAMQTGIDWLIQLVKDTLEISALDSGNGAELWMPLHMPDIVATVADHYQAQAQTSGVTLTAAPPPELPAVYGDAQRLIQALGELVENAVVFTTTGGHVHVTTSVQEDNWVAITVQDTGPGLTDEELPRLFERFFRGRLAESGHIPGVGLGLSIAQQIAGAHGGRITVESTVGEGSAFTLWLHSGFQEEAIYDGD